MFRISEFNRQQKAAVLHDEGPLLIVAGAGTGKTKVLTGRIIYLLEKRKVDPRRILALTFTEKAAQEMTERVEKYLPLGYGEMWIKTFHGFCDSVLREKCIDIGIAPDYKILTAAEQWIFVKKHLFKFELDYYRPLAKPHKFIGHLLSHFSRLKDEAVTPARYLAYAKNFRKRAVSPEEKMEAKKTMELAKAYVKYQELLLKNNFLDYGDLIMKTLELFQKRPNVLHEYQLRFQHVLVDEFQDTNYAQIQILLLLTDKHKNLFVVGDDDQSIYKWRGASVTNILNFEKHFPHARKLVLAKNYRSPQNILDLSYSVIQCNNPNRLEHQHKFSKKLAAGRQQKGEIALMHFDNYLQEIDFVISKIQKLKSGERDAAILVRANQHAKQFVSEMKRLNLPYQYFAENSIFMRPEIKDLLALLRFISNPNDDLSLFRLLAMPVFGLSIESLNFMMQNAKKSYAPLYEYLRIRSQGFNSALEKAFPILIRLIEFSRSRTISELIGKFFEESGYGKLLTKEDTAENAEKLESLAEFSVRLKEFESKTAYIRISDFVEYCDLLHETGEGAPLSKEIDRSITKILTVHGAKGLEFDTVFVPFLVDGKFPTFSRKEPISIPEALIPEPVPLGDHHIEEERRLFYVACTRAKKNLYLTSSTMYEGTKRFKFSRFINEAENTIGLKSSSLRPSPPRTPVFIDKSNEKLRIHRPIRKFKVNTERLSFSHLDTFKTCPLKYRFRYIFNIIPPPSSAANFGNSIHNTLKAFYHLLKTSAPPDCNVYKMKKLEEKKWINSLKDIYEKNWIPYGYDNKAHEGERKRQGLSMIKNLFASNKRQFSIPAHLEKKFDLPLGKICISGRIDRIDRLPDSTFEVIDYKTGSSRQNINLKKDLQLAIYALACRDIFKLPVSKLSFYFIEDDRKISIELLPEDLEDAEREIKKMTGDLVNSDFSPAPGFPCSWCEYRTICNEAKVGIG